MLAHLHATPAHALPRVSPRVRTHAQVRSRAPGQLWPRASGCKTASRKNSLLSCLNSRVRCAPAQTVPRETAPFLVASMSGATDYNYFRTYQPNQGRYTQNDPIGLAGGWNRYGYVGGSPLSFVDPMGLDAWGREMWTPARAWTDMTGQSTTYYDPMTRDLLIIPTRNDVTGSSLPGAAGPYSGEFTYCQYPNSNEFGTAKWRTTDSRYRWVHGGGSGLPDPLSARQGWRSTQGCTRAQNEDVEQLCRKSEQWQSKNPNQTIPYSRW